MLTAEVAAVLAGQAGVIARRQVLAIATSTDVERWLRRRDLVRLHPGVYVDHTGEPTWLQRAWGGVLACGGGAALWGESAMRAHEGKGRKGVDENTIHVVVPRDRRVGSPSGVRIYRKERLDSRVLWNLGPPRQRYDDAALEVALTESDRMERLGALARAVQRRKTTAERLIDALATRPRASDRAWLTAVLGDVAAGTCSVLEQGYLDLIERAHHLPVGDRQVRADASSGVVYRDVQYGDRVLELDGRLFHDSADQRDRDLERDLDAAIDGKGTTRLGWGQVFARPCHTAGKVARLLASGGWTGRPEPCGDSCPVLLAFEPGRAG